MYLYLDTFKYVDTAGVQGSYNEKLGTFFSQKKNTCPNLVIAF